MIVGAGCSNPCPRTAPDWQLPAPLVLDAAPFERRAIHLLGQPAEAFTFEALASPLAGADFNGYGLVFRAQSAARYAVFAVGGDGYLAVLWIDGEEETPLLDWRAFPHVRRGRTPNRLRLACAGGACQFWVNDEHVTSLPDDFGPAGDVGVWARHFEGETLRVQFAQLAVWNSGP